jgi:hypothetical protein
MIISTAAWSQSQQVVQAEYFWDTDPGVGSATPILAEDGALDEAIEALFSNSASVPTEGLHTFNIRIQGQDGAWSSIYSYALNARSGAAITRDVKVTQAEYFWDTDPGIGSATPILAFDGAIDEAVEALFSNSASVPTSGLHTFNIRIQGEDGAWSSLFSYALNARSGAAITRDVKVTQAEYFWDTDPGTGSATPILAFDGAIDEAIEALFSNSASVPTSGLHTFNIRIQGQDGAWSSIYSYALNARSGAAITRDVKVTQAEYFWDTDPGIGTATPILAFDGAIDEAVEALFSNSASVPTSGLHTFNIRIQGEDGAWSSLFSYALNARSATAVTRDVKVTQAEYFWDTDPGIGSATPILAFDGAIDEAVEALFSNSASVPTSGLHTFNIRIQGEDGAWSTLFSYALNARSTATITRDVKVTQAEYFWDADPGIGSATPILAFDGALDEAVESLFSNSASIPTTGLHTFNIRIQGEDGAWSTLFSYALNARSTTTITRDVQVTQAEYFWDADPGQGSASPIVMVNGTLDKAIERIFEELNSVPLTSGAHLFNVRVKGVDGSWSAVFSHAVAVDTSNAPTYSSIDVAVCDGSGYTVPSGDSTYFVAGTYSDTISNLSGGDSIVTITLALNFPTTSDTTASACASFTWRGTTYTNSGAHNDTIFGGNSNGCDSIITLNLTIVPGGTTTSDTTAIACDSYTWYGNTYLFSGTPTRTIPNAAGCDSIITLNLTINNAVTGDEFASTCTNYTWEGNVYSSSGNYNETLVAANGCDSIATLHLTVNPSTTSDTFAVACDSFAWYGNTYFTSAFPTRTIPNANGCDSVITLNLTVGYATTATDVVAGCDSYTWIDGNNYTANNNTAAMLLTSATGCDSLVTLDLTINNSNTGADLITACDSYTWLDGNNYTTNNDTATVTLTNAAGCDSVVTLDLTVIYSSTGSENVLACDSYTWPTNGTTYTSLGAYTATLTNAAGCDSVVTLYLNFNYSTGVTDWVSACNSYTWIDGNTYTSSNSTATWILTNSAGCDSIISLNLSITYPNTGTDIISACNTYTWIDGNNYTASNSTATHTLTNSGGCDSVVTLNLTIIDVNASVTQAGIVLTADETGASYQWLNCPAMTQINGATSQSYTATANGDYAVIVTKNGCAETSACYTITEVGILENSFGAGLLLYPNPTGGNFSIDLGAQYQSTTVSITDINGKLVQSNNYRESQFLNLILEEAAGVYLLIIEAGEKKAVIRLIKE